MLLQFTEFRVEAFDLDHLDLSWTIEDTTEVIDRWDFYILRSVDGPGGSFEEIAGPFPHNGSFRDAEVKPLHNWRTYFYKIRAVNKDTSDAVEVGPASLEAPPDLITVELRRRCELLFSEFAGRRVLVYPAITSGFRCRHCFDYGSNSKGRSIGRQLTQNCLSCFDQTYTGGFQKPLQSWMQIDPTSETVQRTDTAELSRQDTSARLSAFPPLKPKDMIVEAENIRWQVERMTPTQKLRAEVHQEVVLHRIPRSDIRYRVPVDVELLRKASPEREFTRPMNLESAQNTRPTLLFDMLDGLLED